MADRVYIFDTTLRDGEQSPGCSMTVPEKLRMAAKLVELGVDILEAGFPIASEGDFEAVDAISREYPWAHVAALARANRVDVERAAHSLEHARRPRIHTFIATSDIHLKYKLKKSRQQVLGVDSRPDTRVATALIHGREDTTLWEPKWNCPELGHSH